MSRLTFSRRGLMTTSGAALASMSALQASRPAHAFQDLPTGDVIPWLDVLEPNPVPEIIVNQMDWEKFESWLTPMDQFFVIKHYNLPELDEADWQLEISGLVANPMTLTLDQLKSRARREVTFALECSGNTGLPFFNGGIGNAKWAGTPLAPLLEEAGVLDSAVEVVFWGADAGERTYSDVKITEQFARSMTVADALNANNILAYEMNDEPLPPLHGYPARLIAPGWYGVSNVKWLTRIEVRDSRYQGYLMAQEYVTIREEERDGEKVWTFSSVRHDRLKSAPAKVVKSGDKVSVVGAAWGEPVAAVEVSIDGGEWQPAKLSTGEGSEFAWVFWTFDWDAPASGEHTVASRAIAVTGAVQPEPDDPFLAGKTTYYESNGQITRRVQIA